MRDWWYGDKRDIVKWGTLLSLAADNHINRIVHVALYRPHQADYHLSCEKGEPIPLPKEVISHFRDIRDIKRLAKASRRKIDLIKDDFQWPGKLKSKFKTQKDFRTDFFRRLAKRLKQYARQRLIVFLDPDTGIAPDNFDARHVTTGEIESVVANMKSNDVLVFYQHAQRDGKWRQKTRSKFCAAVKEKPAAVAIVTCKDVSNDVCFFVYTKP